MQQGTRLFRRLMVWLLCLGVCGRVAAQDARAVVPADSLIAEGDRRIEQQDYLGARPYFERALRTFTPRDQPQETFHALFWLGEIYFVEGRYREALRASLRADSLVQAMQLSQKLDDYPQLLINLGVFYSQLGQPDSSLQYYQRSFDFSMGTYGRESKQVADAYFSLGAAYKNLGQIEKSIRYTDTSAQIAQRVEYPAGVATAYNNLAYLYGDLNDISKALNFQRRSLQYATNRMDSAIILNNLGSLLIETNNRAQAIDELQASLRLRRQLHPPGHYLVALTRLNMATAYYELGDLEQAGEILQQVEAEIDLSMPGNTYNLQLAYIHGAAIRIQQQQYRQAIAQARKALAINDPEGIPSAYYVMANAYFRRGDYPQALSAIQNGLQAQVPEFNWSGLRTYPPPGQIESFPVMIDLLTSKTAILNRLSETEADRGYDLSAVRTAAYLDSLVSRARLYQKDYVSRELLAADLGDFYAEAIRACYNRYQRTRDRAYLEQAYYYSGKNKALQVSERLSVLPADSLAGVPPALVTEDRRLKSEIDFLANNLRYRLYFPAAQVEEWDKKLVQLQRRRDEVLTQLEQQAPHYFELVHAGGIASIEEVQQQLLQPGEVLLEYFLSTSTRLYLFVISQDEAVFLRLNSTEELDGLVLDFREAIIQKQEAFYPAARQFYQLLVQPARPWLDGADKLAIVPDGALGLMPFELLVDENKTVAGDPHYLLEDVTVRYLFSSRQGIESARVPYTARNGRVWAMAPAFPRGLGWPQTIVGEDSVYLPPLLGNQEEITNLQNRYAGRFFRGRQARKGQLAFADAYSILHISTHALIDDQYPAFSNLLLHNPLGGSYEPLYAYELLARNINTELVVLSACNTGVGKVQPGQGVASLARAFAFAGSADLLMSLWPVRDDTTPFMMQLFYRNLEKGLPKPEALRQAKLSFLAAQEGDLRHPYYWATFIYTGDYQQVYLRQKSSWPGHWLLWVLAGAVVVLAARMLYRKRSVA